MDKLQECFEKGLLKSAMRQPDLAKKDLKQALFFLKETAELLELDKKVMASLSLYNAFFHCARALLFKDGVKERSHYCIARYLESKYVKAAILNTKFLDAFETMMSIRHNAQYSTEEIEIEEDLIELHNVCEEFIAAVENLLK